jgi:tetratricopeptide (TPR) repeat protein
MIVHARACVAIAAIAVLLAPGWAAAQAGMGAWDPEHGQSFTPSQFGKGGSMGSNASGNGVGDPLGFAGSTPQVTNGATSRIDPAIEYAKGFTDLNLGRFAAAEEDFNKALRVDPNNPKTLFMLGEAKVALGELKGAQGAFEKALKYDPGQITIRGEYAVTLARLGHADQAQAQLANLNARAVACGGSCIEADDYKVEVGRIQAALSNAGKANS